MGFQFSWVDSKVGFDFYVVELGFSGASTIRGMARQRIHELLVRMFEGDGRQEWFLRFVDYRWPETGFSIEKTECNLMKKLQCWVVMTGGRWLCCGRSPKLPWLRSRVFSGFEAWTRLLQVDVEVSRRFFGFG